MKYLINESQYRMLTGLAAMNWVKRRANEETMKDFITQGEINFPTLCDDFEDAYEYTDAVIDYAIDELLEEFDEDISDKDYYSDVMDLLLKLCRDKFGDYLIDFVIPALVKDGLDDAMIQRATICRDGRLTDRFMYLKNYSEGI